MAQRLQIRQNTPLVHPENQKGNGLGTRLGLQAVTDFYTYVALQGMVYQVRAGTVTTPLVGDVAITDTAAEMALDAASGGTIIPVSLQISTRLLTGTLHEYAAKSVGTVSSAGAAFTPLNLRNSGGQALPSQISARVAAAGGVTVTAELATTTRRHWEHVNPAAGATGALPSHNIVPLWEPRCPPVLQGAWSFYVQIAATGTGPSYFAHLDAICALTATLL